MRGGRALEKQRYELHPISPQTTCKQEESAVKYLKFWEEKNHQSRILYPVKLISKKRGGGGGIRTFSDHKNWGNIFPVDLPCKKHYKKLFREKENHLGKKCRYPQRKKEHQRRNKWR